MLHKTHYTINEMCESANSNSFNPFTCFFVFKKMTLNPCKFLFCFYFEIMYSVDVVNGITCPLNTYLTILCHQNDHFLKPKYESFEQLKLK